MKNLKNIILSIFFSLLIIGGIVRFAVGFKELYYFDIEYLHIPEITNISEEEIKLNYDYLIDYNLGKVSEEFEMPTIKSSPQGKIHFEEVREIVQNVIKIFVVCLVVCIVGIIMSIKDKNLEVLKMTSKTLIILPITLAIPVLINFDKSFVVFHEILFDNDYWIFDPTLDPVINILPQEFFFHAGVMILVLIFLSSIVIYGVYKFLRRKII